MHCYLLNLPIISGYVIDVPKFPTKILVTCLKPEGFDDRSRWKDYFWLEGRWSNLGLMANPAGSTKVIPKPRCVDLNKCYEPYPELPDDSTVAIIPEDSSYVAKDVNTAYIY